MKFKNIVFSALLGSSVLFTTGCNDDFLEKVQPVRQTDGTFFLNEDDALKALTASYSALAHLRLSSARFILGDVVSDDAVKGSTDTDGAYMSEIKSFTATGSNTAVAWAWFPSFNGIYYANLVLQKVPAINMNEATKKRILAEAKFIRAYLYFDLAKNFGGLPLMPEPAVPGQKIARASIAETYAFIEKDLNEAINDLPNKYAATELGRATKGAAVALLGKMYVYSKNWAKAESTLARLVEGDLAGEYKLVTDFTSIFRKTGEHGSESVFEINYGVNGNASTWDNKGNFGTVFQMPRLWGFGFNQPTQSLVDAFEAGDPRLNAAVMSYTEAQVWESPTLKDVVSTKNTGYYQKKVYLYPNERPAWWRESDNNYRAIRLSDVYLLYAEAAAQTGNATKAQKYLNAVRQRAKNFSKFQAGIGFNVVEVNAATIADANSLASVTNGEKVVMVDILQEDSPLFGEMNYTNANVAAVSGANKWILAEANIIESIDGVKITSVADFENALKGKTAGSTVSVKFTNVKQDAKGTSTQIASKTVSATLKAILPDVTATGDALLQAIYAERRVELSSEHHRFYDLVRTGRAATVLGSAGFKAGKNEVYPLPQTDIDLSNGVLKQNEGY